MFYYFSHSYYHFDSNGRVWHEMGHSWSFPLQSITPRHGIAYRQMYSYNLESCFAVILHYCNSDNYVLLQTCVFVQTNFSTVFLEVKRTQYNAHFTKNVFVFSVIPAAGVIGKISVSYACSFHLTLFLLPQNLRWWRPPRSNLKSPLTTITRTLLHALLHKGLKYV